MQVLCSSTETLPWMRVRGEGAHPRGISYAGRGWLLGWLQLIAVVLVLSGSSHRIHAGDNHKIQL